MPKKVIPGAGGLSPFLLLKDPFYWGVSSAPLGLGVKLSDRRCHRKCEDPPALGSLFRRSRSW